ncbi:ricin-type beta-trefoil lectin domain protein [Streptomyces sp. MS19]|uniref:ricin-type beta-trefoil lectin domain protein n=1 Tax=Streptomyces sp. MS19 TaxID=3385972 RepID=UPI0039A356D2
MSEERFSTTFARKPARPPTGLRPGRRVWTTLCATALVTATVAGAATVTARLLGPDDTAPVATGTVPDGTAGGPGAAPPAPASPEADPTTPEPEPEPADEPAERDEPAESDERDAAAPDPAPPPAPPAAQDDGSGGADTREEEPEEDDEPDDPAPRNDPAPPPAPPAVTGTTGHIIGLAGKCAEVPGSAAGTGSRIGDCSNSANQQWMVASDGTLRIAGKCLALSGGAITDGTRAVLAACAPSDTRQHWRIERTAGDIVNVAADMCLDVANANASNGTPLQIAWCSGNPAQKWSAP